MSRSWKRWRKSASHRSAAPQVGQVPSLRMSLVVERLEDRITPTATLYVDFGDNFPSGTLAGVTTGDLVNIAHGPGLYYQYVDGTGKTVNSNYNASDSLSIQSYDAAIGATAAANRAAIMARVREQYKPFDVTVVELTAAAQTVNGHSVRAAANMNDIANTLAINNGGPKHLDTYILVGRYTIAGHTALPFGGLAPGANGTAAGGDNTGVVPLYGQSVAYTGDSVSHEAGHCFGLEHVYQSGNAGQFGQDDIFYPGITPQANANDFYVDEIMSYSSVFSPFASFFRYPTIDGSNQHGDTYDTLSSTKGSTALQFLTDPNIGPGTFEYVTGTGKNDIITITRTSATTATVVVTA